MVTQEKYNGMVDYEITGYSGTLYKVSKESIDRLSEQTGVPASEIKELIRKIGAENAIGKVVREHGGLSSEVVLDFTDRKRYLEYIKKYGKLLGYDYKEALQMSDAEIKDMVIRLNTFIKEVNKCRKKSMIAQAKNREADRAQREAEINEIVAKINFYRGKPMYADEIIKIIPKGIEIGTLSVELKYSNIFKLVKRRLNEFEARYRQQYEMEINSRAEVIGKVSQAISNITGLPSQPIGSLLDRVESIYTGNGYFDRLIELSPEIISVLLGDGVNTFLSCVQRLYAEINTSTDVLDIICFSMLDKGRHSIIYYKIYYMLTRLNLISNMDALELVNILRECESIKGADYRDFINIAFDELYKKQLDPNYKIKIVRIGNCKDLVVTSAQWIKQEFMPVTSFNMLADQICGMGEISPTITNFVYSIVTAVHRLRVEANKLHKPDSREARYKMALHNKASTIINSNINYERLYCAQ